jgi:hypothetical protein
VDSCVHCEICFEYRSLLLFSEFVFFLFFSISSSELLLIALHCIDGAFAMFIAHLLWIVTHVARFGDSE